MTVTLSTKAERIRELAAETPAKLAREDQNRAEWIVGLSTLGLDLRNAEVAKVAFAMTELLLWHLVDTEGDIQEFGERLIGAATASAEFVE